MAGFFSQKRLAVTIAGLFSIMSMLLFPCIVHAEPDTDIETTTSGFDPAGTYHAALGLKTADKLKVSRFGYYASNPDGVYCPYGEENWNKLTFNEHKKNAKEKGGKLVLPGEFTDAELKGNGTYTVSLEHADFQKETVLSLLQITTDIPLNADVKITDIRLSINKRDIVQFDEAFLEDEEAYLTGGMVVLLLSHRQFGLKGRLSRLGRPEDTPDGWQVLNGRGDERIDVTFTITGFDHDNEDAQPKSQNNSANIRKIIGSDLPDNPAKENERGGISIVAVVGSVLVVLAALITYIVIRKRR